MILFDDNVSVNGVVLKNALAFVGEIHVLPDRKTMSGSVQLSMEDVVPDYKPYKTLFYNSVPYDQNSQNNIATQFYLWLMKDPAYAGGTKYQAKL